MMKSFTVLLLAIVVLAMDAQAQFSWKRVTPEKLDGFRTFTRNPQNPNSIFVVKSVDFGGVFKSEDDGKTWDSIGAFGTNYPDVGGPGGTNFRVFISPHDTTKMFICGNSGGWFMRSTDAGKNWYPFLEPYVWLNSESMFFHPDIPGYIVLAMNNGNDKPEPGPVPEIRISTDYGETWEKIKWWSGTYTGDITDTCCEIINFFCGMTYNANTGDLFLGGANGRILRSSDKGRTWKLQYKPSEYPFYTSAKPGFFQTKTPTICFSKAKPNIGFATYWLNNQFAGSNGGLLKTTDYGMTWNLIRFKDTSLWAMDIIDAGGTVEVALFSYIKMGDLAFFAYSKDEGNSFQFYQNPDWTPSFQIEVSKVEFLPRTPKYAGRNLMYSQQSIIYEINLNAPVSVESEEPAITTAQVTYSNGTLHLHGTSGEQSISLYDIMGKSIGTFTTSTSTVEIGDLPKGVYVCTVSGAVQQSSKFIVY